MQSKDWHLERIAALLDLSYLAKHVLGYSDMSDSLHAPLCDIVQSVNPLIIRLAKQSCPLYGYASILRAASGGTPPTACELGPAENYRTFRNAKLAEAVSALDARSKAENCSFEWDGNNALAKYVEFSRDGRERLFMLFRGSFKTTLISIAHTVQLMLLWPDIRIMIASHKKEGGSQEILGAIKRHFVGNKRFRELFPEYCPKANSVGVIEWGTSERVTLPNRSENCAWPEATIEIAGLTTDVTGRHYDYIKNDDLVTRDSVTNETMIQKTRQFKALQTFLFNQPEWGLMDNVGTFYHFNDIYSTLKKARGITKVLLPIMDDRGNPTFPERFSRRGIEDIKNTPTMTSYDFSCQYMMNPVPPEDQTFKPEWLERDGFYYDRDEIPSIPMKINIFVDPASKQRKESDYTAVMVIGVDNKGMKYVLEVIRDKLNVERRTNLVIDLAKKYHLRKIHYETNGFQATDAYIIRRKFQEQEYYCAIEEITAKVASKEDRIRGLQPVYERGNIRWPKESWYTGVYDGKKQNMVDILRDEMLMFPKCEHDDLLDCHSQMLQISELRASVPRETSEEDVFMRVRQAAIDQHKVDYKLTGKRNVWSRWGLKKSWL